MNFDIDKFNEMFTNGEVVFAPKFQVEDVVFTLEAGSDAPWIEVLTGAPCTVVYTMTNADGEVAEERLMLAWVFSNGSVVPTKAVLTPVRHTAPVTCQESDVTTEDDTSRPVLGDTVSVKFDKIKDQPEIDAKVDTGAGSSSLHFDDMKIVGDVVRFTTKALSGNVIQVPLVKQQTIKSSEGGTEVRPVIKMDITINGVHLKDVEFNLNDRSSMKFGLLIGQNILERGDFMVDPKINEDVGPMPQVIDWGVMLEGVDLSVTEPVIPDPKDLQKLFKLLAESTITFKQLFQHIR